MKISTFFAYLKAVGILFTIATVLFIVLAETFSVSANFWLSDWSNDAIINGTWQESNIHMRLGVYGALGFAQGIYLISIHLK